MAGYSPVIGNRVTLDLYANVRPVKLLPGVRHGISGEFKSVWKPENVDMVMVRENTEGLYADMGGTLATGGVGSVATDVRVITRHASERGAHGSCRPPLAGSSHSLSHYCASRFRCTPWLGASSGCPNAHRFGPARTPS